MFTGLIEEIGTLEKIKSHEKSSTLTFKASKILSDVKMGDSISTNGVCLTVTKLSPPFFQADLMAETLRRSNLGTLKSGSSVNLERALKYEGRLGGHIVSGHIDGTGEILSYEKEDNAVWITVKADEKLLKYIVEKGSVALDGVSLTVAYADSRCFKVSIIPHTRNETTLLNKNIKDLLNIECDIIGKYVEKLLGINKPKENKNSISMDFLKDNGFF